MQIIKITAKDALRQNSYLVCDKSSAILIDAGVSPVEIEEEFKKDNKGLKMPKIEAIFLTHSHVDHICCLEELEKAYSCPIYLKKGFISHLSNPLYNASSLFYSPLTYKPNNITEIVSEDEIKIKEIVVKPIFTSGHTECGICYKIGNNLFSGDTLFYMSYGRTDLAGGNDIEMAKSLEKLKMVDYSICYPGHGIPFYKNSK